MTNSQRQDIKANLTINRTEKLQSSLQDTCLCKNNKPQLVTTIQESEIVCRNCGVVFGFNEEDNNGNTIPYYHTTKSKINLYQKRQKGGNPHDVKKIIHISNLRLENNNNSDIISFADICDKLKLSDVTSESCWKSYCDLKKQTGRFTRAKAMCLAIYQTCRFHHIPFDECNIQDIVCQSLGVKNSPMLKNVIFKIHSYNKSNFSQNSSEKERFYLNLHLSQAQKDHNIDDITILGRIAARYCENLVCPRLNNNDSSPFMKNADYNVLAKRAAKLAIQRCIIQ
jgi:transcription initiation factor TFIIIB Brf1 subunit/transcription initiation factor TFIIB